MWSSLCSINTFLVFLLTTFVLTVYTQKSASEVSKFTFSEKCGEIQEIPGDPRTLIPWNVAIFRRSNAQSSYKFINAGVLLSNTTVLAVFGGVYGESSGNRRYHIPSPESFLIAVGLNSTSLTTADLHTQTSGVTYIRPYRHEEEDNKIFHFWLYHLKDPIRLNTPYAKTPCLPFFLSKLPNFWKLVHGGYTNPPGSSGFAEIKVKPSLTIPDKECANLFKKNYGRQTASYVWCTRIAPDSLKDETEDFCFNHGSVIVSGVLNRYFLAGLTAVIPDKKMGRCTHETTYIQAKTITSIEWMFHNIRCGPNSFSCVNSTCIPLNEVCNHAQNCPDEDKSDEDPIFCAGQNPCRRGPESIQCNIKGPCIRPNQLCDGSVNCPETGGDEDVNFCSPLNPVNTKRSSMSNFTLNRPPPFQSPSIITKPSLTLETLSSGRAQNFDDTKSGPLNHLEPEQMKSTTIGNTTPPPEKRVIKCFPPAVSEGTKMSCKNSLTNQTVDCTEAIPETIATLSCDKYYSPKFRIPQLHMTCTSNGKWDPFKRFTCESNCGILSSEVTALITFAQETSRKNAFPWHAAIFKEKENQPGQFLYTCGGSLVERKIILTAAHCLNDVVKSPELLSKYRIVLAPLSTTYEDNLTDKLAKIYTIKQIRVPKGYDFKSLQSDIAIVQLTEMVAFGPHIRPVCYLKDSTINPNVKVGKVPGFGVNENGEISYYLKFASLPIVSRSECLLNAERDIPPATFCTGYRNGTSVCRGDSGGGFIIPEKGGENETYTLKGIVSAETSNSDSPTKCGFHSYSIFTNVGSYRDWILETLEELRES